MISERIVTEMLDRMVEEGRTVQINLVLLKDTSKLRFVVG